MKIRFLRSFKVCLFIILLTFICLSFKTSKFGKAKLPQNVVNLVAESKLEKKDWHDYEFIEYEKSREGPGEQGKPFILTDPKDIELNDKLSKIEGLYAVVSDKISVNRSIPDFRPEK